MNIENILGINIKNMCELLDIAFPEGTTGNRIIKEGLSYTIWIFTLVGFAAGVVTSITIFYLASLIT